MDGLEWSNTGDYASPLPEKYIGVTQTASSDPDWAPWRLFGALQTDGDVK